MRTNSLPAYRLLTGAFAFFFSAQLAVSAEQAFYLQCDKFLPIADRFAQDCLQRPKPFTRKFYPSAGNVGEIESYSAYFEPMDAPSHFLLGCVLDFKHKINFAGLYYSARPTDAARFAAYDIVFIDPNDNVGVTINGVQNTLIAVRQFVTDVVPPRLRGRPQNCETAKIETTEGANATAHERFRRIDSKQMEYCSGVACRVVSYTTFSGVHSAPLVYAHHDIFLIDAEGVLMVKDSFLKNACSAKRANAAGIYNIVFEMCPQNPQ